MTPTTLAAAILRDVPRYTFDTNGELLYEREVLAALTAALDPALSERAGEVLEGVTPGPWTLCAHLANDHENGCTCGYRGVIFAGDTEYAICQPGHDVVPGEEGLEPQRLPRAQEVANARFIAWCREGVPALLAQNAALRAERDASNELGRAFEEDAGQQRDRAEAAEAQIAALTARVEGLTGALRWAHDTLWEINPRNYDHDDVCKLNDASVEVILGIAPLIGETHGKSPEWWAARAALSTTEANHE